MTLGVPAQPLSDEELAYVRAMWSEDDPRGKLVFGLLATIDARDEEIARILAINAAEHETAVGLAARVAQLEAALRDLASTGHTDTCEAMQPTRGCTCFVDIARAALETR